MSSQDRFFDFASAFEEDPDGAMSLVSDLMMDEAAIRLRVAINSSLEEQFALEKSRGRFEGVALKSDLNAAIVAHQIDSGICNVRDVMTVLRDPELLPSVAAQYRSIVALSVTNEQPQVLSVSPEGQSPIKLQPALATIRSIAAKLIPTELSWWDARFQAWNDTLPGLAGYWDELDDYPWYEPNGIVCTRVGEELAVSWLLKCSADEVHPIIEPIGRAAQDCNNALSIQKADSGFMVTINGKALNEEWCLFRLRPHGGRSRSELVAVAPAVASRKPPRKNEPLRDAVALQDEGRLVEAWHCAANLTKERQQSEGDVPERIDGISKHEYRLKLFVYDIFESMEELVRECRPSIQELLGTRAAAELTTKRLDETKQALLGRIPAPSM